MKRMLKIAAARARPSSPASGRRSRAGWSTVVITDNKPPSSAANWPRSSRRINWAARRRSTRTHTPTEAIASRAARPVAEFGCVVFCDASYSEGTRTTGGEHRILKALMMIKDLMYVPLRTRRRHRPLPAMPSRHGDGYRRSQTEGRSTRPVNSPKGRPKKEAGWQGPWCRSAMASTHTHRASHPTSRPALLR